MKIDSVKTIFRILGWVGLVAICLIPPKTGAAGACISARFNFWLDMGCNQSNGGAGAPATNACPSCPGMPRWWVSEPYLDLCIKDKPLSYTMSFGQEMAFVFYYRQRTELPPSDEIPIPLSGFSASNCGTNASWGLNWNESITVWDPLWERSWLGTNRPPGFAPYSQGYQAFVWRPEGGIDYYNVQSGSQNTINPKSQARMTGVIDGKNYPIVEERINDFGLIATNVPIPDTNGIYWGDSGIGLKLVNSDGSQDIYGLSAGPINDFSSGLQMTTNGFVAAGSSVGSLLLTQRIDAQGRVTQLGYEYVTNVTELGFYFYRLKYVVDPDSRTNRFIYSKGYNVAQIIDPYGRSTRLEYGANGLLSSLKDAAGLTSSFKYEPGPVFTNSAQHPPVLALGTSSGWITSLTTPYGTTSFNYFKTEDPSATVENCFSQLALYVTEPTGAQQLYLYQHYNPLIPGTDVSPSVPQVTDLDNGTSGTNHPALNYRNTYYWGRRQFAALAANNSAFVNGLSNSINLYQASVTEQLLNPNYSYVLLTNSQYAFSSAINSLTTADYHKAESKHWLISSDDQYSITDELSSDQDPSPDAAGQVPGLRTWYDYRGKPSPEQSGDPQITCVARLLPDGTSQYTRYHYYPVTSTPGSPAGSGLVSDSESSYTLPNGGIGELTNWFVYAANSIDLAAISNSAGQYVSYVYNGQHQVTTITNALRQVTTLTWDYYYPFHLLGVQWPSSNTATLSYYAGFYTDTNPPTSTSSMLRQVVLQPEGRTFTFNNYSAGSPSSITDDRGLTVVNTWDGLNRLTSTTFPDTTTISNVYGRLDVVASKDRLNHWTYFSYDGLQHLTTVTNANHAVTTYDWCGCGSLTSVLDALTNLTILNYDNQGNLASLVFPDNSSLTYQYDLAGRLTNALDGAGHAFALGYNNQDQVTTINSSYGLVSQALYDSLNRPVRITDANGITVTNTYDALSELLTRTWPDSIGEGFGYSASGLIAYTNRDHRVTLYGLDAAGRLTSVTNANQEITRFSYDSLDHVISMLDGLQHTTTWNYNEYGWLTNKVDGDGRQVFKYVYDANGRPQSRWTPQNGSTAYAYDPVGNLINVVYGRSTVSYAYDALNRLTNMVDAVGTTAFGYTPVGQLQSETGPWANDTVTNGYTQHLRTALGLAQPGGWWQQSYAYDAAGRLTNVISPAGAFNYVLGGHGAASALVSKLSLPNGGNITNGYDALARLQQTALNNSSGMTLDGYGYQSDPLGLRTNIVRNFGTTTSTASMAYDALGQLTNWVAQEGAGTSRLNEQYGWGYDAAHNLHSRANNALSESFTTDAANQLTGISRSGSLTVAGNLLTSVTSLTVNGQTAQVYGDLTFARSGNGLNNGANTYTNVAQNATGKIVTNTLTVNLPLNATLLYDGNGNLTNDGLKSFAYDAENELTNVQVAGQWQSAFVYDGLGRRRIERDYAWASGTWVRTNEEHYIYDGLLILQQRDASNNVVVTYTRGRDLSGSLQGAGGIGGLLARTDGNGSTFYHADGSGNITALMNGSQNLVARYLYNPFGQITGKWGPLADVNAMQFSSMPHHNLSGMSLYLFRAYEPNLQRWLNQDPIGEVGGVNLYGFVFNNPESDIDMFGLLAGTPPISAPVGTGVTSTSAATGGAATAETAGAWAARATGYMGLSLAGGYLIGDLIGVSRDAELQPNGVNSWNNATSPYSSILPPGVAYLYPGEHIDRHGNLVDSQGNVLVDSSGKVRNKRHCMNDHHSIPKFLGGDGDQDLEGLDKYLHGAFHNLLRQNLLDAGFPDASNTSASAWAGYFQNNPGSQDDALDILLDTSRTFDATYGTQVTQSIWQNIMDGNYTSYP